MSKVRVKLIKIFFALVLLIVGFAGGQHYLHKVYERQIEVGYRRALSEFATHLQELTSEMGRSRLAVSDKQRHLIGANIRRLVYAAQSNMGELPLGEIQTERIAGLLAQAYEQSYIYEQNRAVDTDHLYEQIKHIYGELQNVFMVKAAQFPWVSWHEYLGAKLTLSDYLQTLTAINNGLDELKTPVRRGEIKGEQITPDQALKAARAFWDKTDLNYVVTNESKGNLPSYTVEAEDEGEHVIIEVSQKGGMVLWMTAVREVLEKKFELAVLVNHGLDFLQKKDFPAMHLTDAQILQNRATLTFVPELEGVLLYTSPVKVQVSAEDGSIIGFWGVPYYVAQSRAQLPFKKAAEEEWEVADKVGSSVEILDEKLALIPAGQEQQILTKRLGVQYQEEHYLIYLNVLTGEEEQITRVSSPEFF